MKKILFLIYLALLPFYQVIGGELGQPASENIVATYVYCEVRTYFEVEKIFITIDYGDGKRFTALKDEDGKKVSFSGIAEMLNYMTKQGWELVIPITTINGGNGPSFLFRKEG
jgi:hypothetical protein